MKSNHERPAARRARILSLTALAPLMLAACSGPAAAPEHAASQPSPPAGKHFGNVEKASPETGGTVGKIPGAVIEVLPADDPSAVPEGEATEPAPAAEPAVFTSGTPAHVVRAGDTLQSIADGNGWGSWSEVAAHNNIPAPYILFEGQSVSSPSAGSASAQPAGLTLTPAPAAAVKETPAEAPAVEAEPDSSPAAPVEEAEEAEAPAPIEDAQPEPVRTPAKAPVVEKPVAAEPVIVTPVVEASPAPEPVVDTPAAKPAPAPAPVETPEPVVTPVEPEPVVQAPAAPAPVVTEPAVTAPVVTAPASGSSEFAQRSLELINEYRTASGVHALAYDPALEALAVNWAGSQKDAIDANGWAGVAHNPDLVNQLPGNWSNYAENIAVNYSPEDMFQWWTNSPSHNSAMLSPALDSFGFGSAELDPQSWLAGNHVGVQVFARY